MTKNTISNFSGLYRKISMKIIKQNYTRWFEQIKQRIQEAQLSAVLSVNDQLLQAYWELGEAIIKKQQDTN